MMSYSSNRHQWAVKMQKRHAIPIYEEWWPNCRIEEVDEESLEREGAARVLDFSGIDKIIELESGESFHLAQRFRVNRGKRTDFTLRYQGVTGRDAEYKRLLTNYESRFGSIPPLYSFGIGTSSDRSECLKNGFKFFALYDLNTFMEELATDEARRNGPIPNRDGSTFFAYSLEDMEDYLVKKWTP